MATSRRFHTFKHRYLRPFRNINPNSRLLLWGISDFREERLTNSTLPDLFFLFDLVWFGFLTKIRANPNQIIELKNFSNPNQIFEYFGFDFFKSNTLPISKETSKSKYIWILKYLKTTTRHREIGLQMTFPFAKTYCSCPKSRKICVKIRLK